MGLFCPVNLCHSLLRQIETNLDFVGKQLLPLKTVLDEDGRISGDKDILCNIIIK